MCPGWEPWSSDYGRRLTFWRLWVWIPVPYTGWTFFHINCCKIVLMFVWKRPKINEKEAGLAHFLKKSIQRITEGIHGIFFTSKCSIWRVCCPVIIYETSEKANFIWMFYIQMEAKLTVFNCFGVETLNGILNVSVDTSKAATGAAASSASAVFDAEVMQKA